MGLRSINAISSFFMPGAIAMKAALRACQIVAVLFSIIFPVSAAASDLTQSLDPQTASGSSLKQLTLEQLGDVEITSVSKEPESVWRTPAAIFVLTQEDIRRSGATSIPELLRLVPGVEVARIDADHWSIGIRGFGSSFSKSLLLLIDG